MEKQHSALVNILSNVSAVPNLHRQPKLSLINRLINDHLLDAWPTVFQMSPQLINISHRILIDPLL